MLDHKAARRLRQGAHAAGALIAAMLVCAAPAAAQVEIPIISPPVVPPPAPGPETSTLGGDAAHRNGWLTVGLRPPLEVAWKVDALPAVAPLAVGTRVIVESENALTAYNATDGDTLWNVPLQEPGELATDGERVFVATASGLLAVSAATGEPAWESPGPASSGPTVADGRVIVGTAPGTVTAYDTETGAEEWSVPTGISDARPAVSGNRAFVTGRCSATAIATTTGLPIWSHGCAADTGTRTLLGGHYAFGEDAGIYDADDGTLLAEGQAPGTIGSGVVIRSPLGAETRSLDALDAGGFRPRWSWQPPLPGRMLLRPAAVDANVWQVVDTDTDGLLLGAIDAGTGAERWSGFLPVGSGNSELVPGVATAVATMPGLLLVPIDGGGLAALRNAEAGPLSVRRTSTRKVYLAGARALIKGRLRSRDHGLVGPRPVRLEADVFPFDGVYEVVGSVTAGRSGFSFSVPIARNARYRFVAEGVAHRPTTIYAEPKLSVVYARTARPHVVRATLRIAATPGLRRGGVRVGVYRRRAGTRTLTRLGRGVADFGGTATFNVRIPRRLGRTDRILTCMRGASRQGFGFPDVLDRRCGASRVALAR